MSYGSNFFLLDLHVHVTNIWRETFKLIVPKFLLAY